MRDKSGFDAFGRDEGLSCVGLLPGDDKRRRRGGRTREIKEVEAARTKWLGTLGGSCAARCGEQQGSAVLRTSNLY